MSGELILFYIFAASTCGGAIAVVVSQNVVRMAFWLMVSLGSVSGLFFLLGADFVGATQLLIYVGGTVVLLVFGVMLTASARQVKVKTSPAEGFLAAGIGALFLTMIIATVASVDWDDNRAALDPQFATFVAYTKAYTKSDKEGHAFVKADADKNDKLARDEVPAEHQDHLWPIYDGVEFEDGDEKELTQDELKSAFYNHEQTQAGNTARKIGLALLGPRVEDLESKKETSTSESDAEAPKLSIGYLLPFEIVSIHLLVVLIGAAYLARAKRRPDQEVG